MDPQVLLIPGGGGAIAVQGDVGEEDQIVAMFRKVDARLGRLRARENNAGLVDARSRVDEMSGPSRRGVPGPGDEATREQ